MSENGVPRKRIMTLLAIIAVVLLLGVFLDAVSGFPILAGFNDVSRKVVSLFLLGTLYILGEGAIEWINARDDTKQPLWVRVPLLFLLLLMAGGICFLMYAVIKI